LKIAFLIFQILLLVLSIKQTSQLFKAITCYGKKLYREILLFFIITVVYLLSLVANYKLIDDVLMKHIFNYITLYVVLNLAIFDLDYFIFRIIDKSKNSTKETLLIMTSSITFISAVIFGICHIIRYQNVFTALPYGAFAVILSLIEWISLK